MSGLDSYDQQAATNLHRLIEEKRQATRTPDPAQIRADALREVLAKLMALWEYDDDGFTIEQPSPPDIQKVFAALIDAPPSPPAVDGGPAPDAGGKEGV